MWLALTFLLGRGSRSLHSSPSYCETECRLSCLLMKVALPASYILYETVYTSRKQMKSFNLSTECVCSLVKLGSVDLLHFSISMDTTGKVDYKCFRSVQTVSKLLMQSS
uniref:Putative secreted protein n=1 Tax=Ixodes ricinus TaxID=34613 RepID=A0A6B0UIR6_IXORI